MVRFSLVVALIAGAVMLGLRVHERLRELLLVDLGTGVAVYFHGWEIPAEFAEISGVVAAAAVVLAIPLGLVAAFLHGRFVLKRQRERLRATFGHREIALAEADRARAERRLTAIRKRLKTERGQRARYRRSMRAAERDRDRLRKAVAAERRRADGAAFAVRQLLDEQSAHRSKSRDTPRGAASPATPRRRRRPPPRGTRPSP
ncbi:MAG: hypothetical protein OXK76_07635 [Gammaproteobacteria bacterium]|nr:hypothetical protein [Gammaproteobacteria bacterium]